MNIDDIELEENTPEPKKEEKEKERYKSREGFVEAQVIRGYTEIMQVALDVWGQGGIICGGYVRYMCSPLVEPSPASDVDVYCPTDQIFNDLKKLFEYKGMTVRHENEISLTFARVTDYESNYFGSPPVQLIKPMKEGRVVTTGTMEDILSNFDFTVIRAGLTDNLTALVDADFIHDETHKFLRLKNIHCPISSTLRCCKYSRKGYWLSPYNAFTLFQDWDRRDDEYREKIAKFLEKSTEEELSQEQIDELEKLMRID